jgi:uncharacterized protein involved in response to NO
MLINRTPAANAPYCRVLDVTKVLFAAARDRLNRRMAARANAPVVDVAQGRFVRPVVAARTGPPPPWLFASAMGVAVCISLFGGTVLGYLAATQHGLTDRWTEAVQAHGHLQLVGWAAVFICALLFEFGPRISMRPMLPLWPRAAALALLAGGAVLEAVGQVWHAQLGLLFPVGAVLVVAGAGTVLMLLRRLDASWTWRQNMHPLWLLAGATWLTVAVLLEAGSIIHANASVTPLHESRLTTELLLRGFVLQVILGIAMRAFPGHFGVPPMSNNRQRWLFAALNVTVLAWAASSGAFGMPDIEHLRQAADVALGAELLLATHWLGIVGVARGARRGPRYQPLAVIAWVALVVYALLLIAEPFTSGWATRTLYEEGAVRHVFMLGFMAPLMVALAHLVLERFGTGRVLWRNTLTTAFFFVVVAWPLRVGPAIAADAPGAMGRNIMGVAAAMLTVGLVLFGAVCLRNAFAFARIGAGRTAKVR